MVRTSASTVEAWSISRLEEHPHAWQLDFRAALRGGIGALRGSADASLAAAYVSPDHRFADAENALFFNVGTAAFSTLRVGGVIFERSQRVPLPPPALLSGPAAHYQRYEVTTHREPSYWSVGAPIASFASDAVRGPLAASSTWWAIRNGTVRRWRRSTASPLCLRATVGVPVLSPTTLYATMKPLLDGLVAAFHGHDGSDIDEAAARLGARLEEDPADVKRRLLDDELDLLGARPVVTPYRDGVMWSPDDERLVAADLRAAVEPETRITGDLFEASML